MPGRRVVSLRLYVAGDAPNSLRAVSNITEICRRRFADAYELEIVDVFEEPERALEDSVFITPQLVVVSPAPMRVVVGDLSEPASVLEALEIGQDCEPDRNSAP